MGANDSINPILQLALRIAGVRKATRLSTHAKAKILINGDTIEGEVENLSMSGVCVLSDKHIKVNSSCNINFDELSTSQTILDIKAKVVWAVDNMVGLQFVQII